MIYRLSLLVLLTVGFGLGWLARSWWITHEKAVQSSIDTDDHTISPNIVATPSLEQKNQSVLDDFIRSPLLQEQPFSFEKSPINIVDLFQKLLNAKAYDKAMVLFQEHIHTHRRLKITLLSYLDSLLKNQNYDEFIALTNLYLYTYYDDVHVLLRLADFNYLNGLYIEAVNVYQLANAYAYRDSQARILLQRFDKFVNSVDGIYAAQEDWFSLSNFYNHIETSDLLLPDYEYRQALVYLRLGNQYLAREKLERIANNSVLGDKAKDLLASLQENSEVAIPENSWNNSASIALLQKGNQYWVNVNIGRDDRVTLLIDTGASMTILSKNAFESLNVSDFATKLGQRIFQTANGLTQGTLYSIQEFGLGPYVLENIQIAVLDFEMSFGVDGLLGMNTLGQFNFQIDQNEKRLLLRKK